MSAQIEQKVALVQDTSITIVSVGIWTGKHPRNLAS